MDAAVEWGILASIKGPLADGIGEFLIWQFYCNASYVNIPYSQKYWRELNLAVGSQMAIVKVLADFNLAVRYRIAIHIYASNLVVVEVDCQTTKFKLNLVYVASTHECIAVKKKASLYGKCFKESGPVERN